LLNILQYPFFQNALLAGSVIAVAAALLGYFLVVRGLTFAGHALSNIGFAGAAGAVLVGVHPVYGLLAFTTVASLTISLLGKEIRERDIAVGVVMTCALGIGVLFLSLYQGYAEQAYSILFGTILGITRQDVVTSAVSSLVLVVALAWLARPLLFSSFDPQVAEARGVPVRRVSTIFLILVALAVSMAVQVIGVLLIFALLVGPPATAVRLAPQPGQTIGLAVILGIAYTWLGILLAANSAWPVSFFIAIISFSVYLPVRLFSKPGWKRVAQSRRGAGAMQAQHPKEDEAMAFHVIGREDKNAHG
jgi:zinc/manganese transport system permease protein